MKIYKLSENAKTYLQTYQEILMQMKSDMENVVPTNSISETFIKQMLPHHRAAIEMSKNILNYTTNIEIEEVAKKLIEFQKKDIEDFQEDFDECSLPKNSERDIKLYNFNYGIIFNNMIRQMENSYSGNDVDLAFIDEMISHHEGALKMAQNVLMFDICEDMREEAEEIIINQTKSKEHLLELKRKLKGG